MKTNLLFAISSLLASMVSLFLAWFVYSRDRKNYKNSSFALVSSVIAIWTSYPFMMNRMPDGATALLMARIIYLIAIFTPPVFLRFVLFISEAMSDKKARRILTLTYVISTLLFISNFTPLFIRSITFSDLTRFSLMPGPLYPVFILLFGLVVPYSCYRLFATFKKSGGIKRNQFKYILVAFTIAAVGGIIHFASLYGIKEIFPHDLFLVAYGVITVYAIAKHHLMDINVIIRRSAIYSLTLGVLVGGYILLVMAFQAVFQRIWGYEGAFSWAATALAALIIALTFEFLKEKVTSLIDKAFYRDKYNYRQTIKDFSRIIRDNLSLAEIPGRLSAPLVEQSEQRMLRCFCWVQKMNSTRRHR